MCLVYIFIRAIIIRNPNTHLSILSTLYITCINSYNISMRQVVLEINSILQVREVKNREDK